MASLDPSFRVGSQVAEAIRAHEKLSRRRPANGRSNCSSRSGCPTRPQVARRYPHELSGGMAQRVCIALALAGQPEVLIADEPTTALDVTVQAEILGAAAQLQAETGMSVILVTHDWGVVADICDRAVVMYAGQVVEQSPRAQPLPRAAPPVHAGPAGMQSRALDRHGGAAGHPGHRAAARPVAASLPVPSAVPVRAPRSAARADPAGPLRHSRATSPPGAVHPLARGAAGEVTVNTDLLSVEEPPRRLPGRPPPRTRRRRRQPRRRSRTKPSAWSASPDRARPPSPAPCSAWPGAGRHDPLRGRGHHARQQVAAAPS